MLLVKNAPGGGATFFLTLEAELVRAHDANRINETALLELLQIINLGQPVTWVDLARVFGVDTIFGITRELRGQTTVDEIVHFTTKGQGVANG